MKKQLLLVVLIILLTLTISCSLDSSSSTGTFVISFKYRNVDRDSPQIQLVNIESSPEISFTNSYDVTPVK